MKKKELRNLDVSYKQDIMSDAEWQELNKGYQNLQVALHELANEIGADYEADISQDQKVKCEDEVTKTTDIVDHLLTTAGNKSIMGRPSISPESLSTIDPYVFLNSLLTGLDNPETRQLVLYPADSLGTANCILEKIDTALDLGYSKEKIYTLLDKLAFNLNVPVATGRNPDVEAFILPNGAILFQNEDRFYKIKPNPLKEIIINKAEFIQEIVKLSSANTPLVNDQEIFSRIIFLSHDCDAKAFTKLNTPPQTLNDNDQCVAIMLAGIDLSTLKRLNPNGILSKIIDNEQIVVLRSFLDRVFVYGVEYASNCYYNDNKATDDTLAAVYSVAALRDYQKPVRYDFLDEGITGFADPNSKMGMHFIERTRWLCERAGFNWLNEKLCNAHNLDLSKLVEAKIVSLDYMQPNIFSNCWGYAENLGCVSYAKLQYENCFWHPRFFNTQRNVPISYPILTNYAQMLSEHPCLFLLDLSLSMFEDLDDLTLNYKNKFSSLICQPLSIAESDVMIFNGDGVLVGKLNETATHQFIKELADDIRIAMTENDVDNFPEALDYVDYPCISIGFCKEGLPLKNICNLIMKFSEDYEKATLTVPHLGIYQSFDYGDLDSGNISYGLI